MVASSGSRRGSISRGAIADSPRTTTVSRTTAMSGPAASSSMAARPENTARRNQRGPSTPTNRAGANTVRPSGPAEGIRVRSSGPSSPRTSSAVPPWLTIDSAISERMPSQTPMVRGAAKACSCTAESAMTAVAPTTCWACSSTSSRSSMSATPRIRSAPRSRRPSSRRSTSEASNGPAGTASADGAASVGRSSRPRSAVSAGGAVSRDSCDASCVVSSAASCVVSLFRRKMLTARSVLRW